MANMNINIKKDETKRIEDLIKNWIKGFFID